MTFGSATCGLGLLAIRDPMHYLAVSTLERVRIEPHKLCHTPVFPATRACRTFDQPMNALITWDSYPRWGGNTAHCICCQGSQE